MRPGPVPISLGPEFIPFAQWGVWAEWGVRGTVAAGLFEPGSHWGGGPDLRDGLEGIPSPEVLDQEAQTP